MNIKEALDELKDKCRRAGAEWAEKVEPNQRQYDKAIPAAEAAVLALYEQQQKVADELAEALDEADDFLPCYGCYCKGKAPAECVSLRCCTLAEDWQRISGLAEAALAAYNKAKEGR